MNTCPYCGGEHAEADCLLAQARQPSDLWIDRVAADIAARVPELVRDCAVNNAEVIAGIIRNARH